MTGSEDIPQKLIEQLARGLKTPNGGLRNDILTLLRFREGVDSDNPVDLFWDVCEPREITNDEPLPRLSEQTEGLVLDFLERLYRRHQVPYAPDVDDSDIRDFLRSLEDHFRNESSEHVPIPDKLKDLVACLHVAAARAFRIMQSQDGGLSEEALDCLREVERTMDRLNRAGFSHPSLDTDVLCLAFRLSAVAVSAKVFVELSRVRRSEGHYADALHYLARAARDYDFATFVGGMEGVNASWPTIRIGESDPPQHSELRSRLGEGLADITPKEIASTFLLLKGRAEADNWAQISEDCKIFAESNWIFGPDAFNSETYEIDEFVEDEHGTGVIWGAFWYAGEVWARAQLSRSEYQSLRQEDKRRESADRLGTYFFGRDWPLLPERARRYLRNADVTWNSKGQMGWEAVLSDLHIATEEMCLEFIWRPLESSSGRLSLLEFVQLKTELHKRGDAPGIQDFTRICEFDCYAEFLKQRRLSSKDVQFLTKELPSSMRQLRGLRNRAVHGTGKLWKRDQVRPYFQALFGIGRPGVLPELARIGRKLSVRRTQR